VQAPRIRVSAFFTFRQSNVVSVGVQDPVILRSEDDKMKHIVIIGRFDELMPTLAIQPSSWISMPKTANLGELWLYQSHAVNPYRPNHRNCKRNMRSK
jgi:hypothetical protein